MCEWLDVRWLLSFNIDYFRQATWNYEAIRGDERGTLTQAVTIDRPDYTIDSSLSLPSDGNDSQTEYVVKPGHLPAEDSTQADDDNGTVELIFDTPVPNLSFSKVGDTQQVKGQGKAKVFSSDGNEVDGTFKQTFTETLQGIEDVNLPNGWTFEGAKHYSTHLQRVITISNGDAKATETIEQTANIYNNGAVGMVSSQTDSDVTTVANGKTTTDDSTTKLEIKNSSLLFNATLDGSHLSISGSIQADSMRIYRDGDDLDVLDNGALQKFPAASVKSILVEAGNGNDTIELDSGVVGAMIDGGDGDDVVRGGDGADTIFGGAGDNELFGGGGNDILHGDVGNDALYGQAGRDKLYGNGGNDLLDGGGGVDHLDGGDGNDMLVGGGGNDQLFGEAGKDTLEGQAGSDLLDGGPQVDTALVDPSDQMISIQHVQHVTGSSTHAF